MIHANNMTTQELLDNIDVNSIYEVDKILYFSEESVKEIMIKFAKYHVEQALKEASEKSYAKADASSSLTTKRNNLYWTFGGNIGNVVICKESILNSYNLTNIK